MGVELILREETKLRTFDYPPFLCLTSPTGTTKIRIVRFILEHLDKSLKVK